MAYTELLVTGPLCATTGNRPRMHMGSGDGYYRSNGKHQETEDRREHDDAMLRDHSSLHRPSICDQGRHMPPTCHQAPVYQPDAIPLPSEKTLSRQSPATRPRKSRF